MFCILVTLFYNTRPELFYSIVHIFIKPTFEHLFRKVSEMGSTLRDVILGMVGIGVGVGVDTSEKIGGFALLLYSQFIIFLFLYTQQIKYKYKEKGINRNGSLYVVNNLNGYLLSLLYLNLI